MSSNTASWWQRIAGSLRGGGSDQRLGDLPRVGEDGLLVEPAQRDAALPPDGPVNGKSHGSLARWPKRDQAITHLQEAYDQVTHLMGDIHTHLAEQSIRTNRICAALEQLARSTSDLPEISRQQADVLGSIAGQLEHTNARTQKLNDTLSDLPKVAHLQTETLTGIGRHLEVVGEQNIVTAQAMEKLGNAIRAAGDMSSAQTEILRQIITRAEEHSGRVNHLIASQSRRFVMLFVVTLLLAGSAIAAVAIALVRHP